MGCYDNFREKKHIKSIKIKEINKFYLLAPFKAFKVALHHKINNKNSTKEI